MAFAGGMDALALTVGGLSPLSSCVPLPPVVTFGVTCIGSDCTCQVSGPV